MRCKFVIVLLFFIANSSFGKDYGQVGPVYPVVERSLLEFIYSKLSGMSKNGELEKINQKMIAKLKKNVDRPSPKYLPAAKVDRERYFDPSIVIKDDIRSEKGVLIAKAGTRVNPFSYVGLSKKLIFINADRSVELEFAKKKLVQNPNNKIILISGSLKSSNLELKKPVYFDQESRLVNRLGIAATPSVVEQSGAMLLIKEIAL